MTETSFLAAIRESYDTVAVDYEAFVKPPSELDPLTRAMLGAFAEQVRETGGGKVADLGCGPGKVTAHLVELGLDAFGVDLSPRMVELARRAYPTVRFDVGTMTALDLPDSELDGTLAFFSTHHTPPDHLPTVFAELHRTLKPGGRLMLWTHTGADEHRRPTKAYGDNAVSYESHLLPADRLAALLNDAGLVVTARLQEEVSETVPRENACFLATKPPSHQTTKPAGVKRP